MNEGNTNDTLGGAAAEAPQAGATATPVQHTQAGSETSSEVSSQAAKTEEKLYAGKFKSPEELEKGYKEAEQYVGKAKEYEKQASLLAEVAKQSGLSVEDIQRQVEDRARQKEMENSGITDPNVYEIKKELAALKAEKVTDRFEREWATISSQNPALSGARDVLRDMYMSKPDQTVQQLVDRVYNPVIQQAQSKVAEKLEAKAAFNMQPSRGSGPVPDDTESRLKKKAIESGNPNDIQELMVYREKKNRQK